jgi:LysM repeat protein
VGGTHTVLKGETLSLIASREKVSIDDLAAGNSISRNSVIREGQKLKIPAPGAAKKAASKATSAAPKSSGSAPAAPAAPAGPAIEPLKIIRFTAEPAPAPAADAGAPVPAPTK